MKKEIAVSLLSILLLISLPVLASVLIPGALAEEDFPFERLEDVGTHFELQRFDTSITTNDTVNILLYVASERLFYFIESASEATRTQLTLDGLDPLTTYFMYEDTHMNEHIFTTDDSGSYTYIQDLSNRHHVFIQRQSGTIYIRESTTLHADVWDTVEILASNIVLDLNGHSVIGGPFPSWWGIYIPWISHTPIHNVTIKNGSVRNFMIGCALNGPREIVFDDVTVTSRWFGYYLSSCEAINVTNSVITSNRIGIEIMDVSDCYFYHNNFIENAVNVRIWRSPDNCWDDGYPSGGNYWSDYTGQDQCRGQDQNEPGSDGIGDTAYTLNSRNVDNYPFMMEDGWVPPQEFIQNEVQVVESWELNDGVEKSLISKLEAASDLLDKGNTNGAIRKLGDLIKKVTNDAYHLTEEQKDYIIVTTEGILARI